jgi:tetratricopeptide (TPR) repeat protein
LLISFGEIDQALEQYVALSDAYFQLAQVDKAMEKYAEAFRLSSRASDEKLWQAKLLRQMADVQVRRGNWRDAKRLYQQLLMLVPNDDRARLNLIDLNFKLGLGREADKQVLAMLEHYRQTSESKKGLALLEEAVRLQPQQMALRARLARAYIDASMKEEAIGELDTLGEMQLDAGLHQQARATINFIITLKPVNIEAYRQLLARI